MQTSDTDAAGQPARAAVGRESDDEAQNANRGEPSQFEDERDVDDSDDWRDDEGSPCFDFNNPEASNRHFAIDFLPGDRFAAVCLSLSHARPGSWMAAVERALNERGVKGQILLDLLGCNGNSHSSRLFEFSFDGNAVGPLSFEKATVKPGDTFPARSTALYCTAQRIDLLRRQGVVTTRDFARMFPQADAVIEAEALAAAAGLANSKAPGHPSSGDDTLGGRDEARAESAVAPFLPARSRRL